ncbi:DgyrCDS4373 [Dimorphilus gyrociliatus]|uniref:DgyrCDS4373 n=1 Tax=Dimorphilus gyrociliatus TaxID=2664684 RepID=A0A7I8VGU4_9ANNE|nr:DgyrCDS4373 [Dimorphilus gyrociliatus]
MANHMNVKLHIYDLSKGLAKQISMMMLGKQIDGVWHTGVVVYGREFFFGGAGIQHCPPCGTVLGSPDNIVQLGRTNMSESEFKDFLKSLSIDEFNASKYHLLKHNCNTFSDRICQMLVQQPIPSYITSLPNDVMSTPFGKMLAPVIESMTVAPEGGMSVDEFNRKKTPNETSNSPLMSIKMPLDLFNEQKVEIKSKLDSNSFDLLEESYKYASQDSNSTEWSIGRFHIRSIISALSKIEDSKQKNGICSLLTNCLKMEETVDVLLDDPKEPIKDFFSLKDPKVLLNPLINATSSVSLSDKVMRKHAKESIRSVVSGLLENIDCTSSASKLAYNLLHSNVHDDEYENCLEIGSALIENISSSDFIYSASDEDCLTILRVLDMSLDGSSSVADLANSTEFHSTLQNVSTKRENNKDITEMCNFLSAKLLSLS